MSVTAPLGFRAAGVSAGIGEEGVRDVAVLVNDGPSRAAGAVFGTDSDRSAPALWSRQVLAGGRVRAVVLNSGCANVDTVPLGFQDVHALAEHTAVAFDDSAAEIVLCAVGPVGVRPPLGRLTGGVTAAVAELSRTGGLTAADAVRTTDTVVKIVFRRGAGYTVGAMAKGPDPSLSTGLYVVTTDAELAADRCRDLIATAAAKTLPPLTGPADTALLMAGGAAGVAPDEEAFAALLAEVCADLAAQIDADPATTEHENRT
ncbi:bifunctional ornithine acetyltransferase/N-acetylglutamate synthase [Nocardiopsis sp. N85]|uniref:bifunctional ornithine acetyltransferase/N-acetylglutamate synthase n=1 Tax=Nocardiopsis sp. N85 TaxID=3029400 RepID=UPI00237F46DE|nr:bifunctional ornithine acetyltransferase/N-acetylglutamate synthase [Nocardiopsis sp. N85]MDE3724323.1 bifunctional ornithine acetyltransferase/N-acetylglutamate synthase [Nocardiopsis sp. N85]